MTGHPNPVPDFIGSASPLAWWHAADDLWRWGARVGELWLDDLADPPTRTRTRTDRLDSLIAHARSRSAFYAEHYRDVPDGCTDLTAYPRVDRARLMGEFDRWVVDPAIRKADLLRFVADPARIAEPYLGQYAVWTSSGTTGVPGIYVQDPDAMALYTALMTQRFLSRASTPAGSGMVLPGTSRMAFVAALEGHFAGVVSWERQRRLHPVMAASTRAFSILQPLAELVVQLRDWQPECIASYPTMLMLLADEQRAGRLAVSPSVLWSGGETLSAPDRRAIESAFGCAVLEDYGASECMNMAFGCPQGRLHLNDDWVILEPIDGRGNPVPPGQPSVSVLVTNLANRVQPLIRYDLSDSVTLDADACPCGNGRPTLRVGGRRDDILRFERARIGGASISDDSVGILPLAVETVIEEEAGIHRFQLTQTAPDRLSLRLDSRDPAERAAALQRVGDALARLLAAQGARPAEVTLEEGAPEANPVSGKLRQVRAACR